MGEIKLIVALALATYFTRIIGFAVAARSIPPAVDRFLGYIPIAAFAALIAPGLGIGTPDILPRVFGAIIATVVVVRWKVLWAGLLSGFAGFWAVSLLPIG